MTYENIIHNVLKVSYLGDIRILLSIDSKDKINSIY